MERKTAAEYDPQLLAYDRYVHGDIDRRQFLDDAARFAIEPRLPQRHHAPLRRSSRQTGLGAHN